MQCFVLATLALAASGHAFRALAADGDIRQGPDLTSILFYGLGACALVMTYRLSSGARSRWQDKMRICKRRAIRALARHFRAVK